MNTTDKSIHEWTVSDVAKWLDENGLSKHKALLCDEHQIDGSALISLNESDLRKPPVEMTVLGIYFMKTNLPVLFTLIGISFFDFLNFFECRVLRI